MAEPLADRPESWQLKSHQVKATGRVQDFVEDEIISPSGEQITRQYAAHPGAVGIIALDDQDRIAVVHQYRHPVGMRLVEPPAGILDIDGEDPLAAAKRELAEEAQLAAEDWRVLVDLFTSPGGLAESLRIYLARDLRPAPRPDGFEVEGEEVDMGLHWICLDDAVALIYAGEAQNPTFVAGVLALAHAKATDGLDQLRPADADWPARQVRSERLAAYEKLS